MDVILDEMNSKEFFAHGGVVKIIVKNDEIVKKLQNKKKYVFLDNRSYIRFLKTLYFDVIPENYAAYPKDIYEKIFSILDIEAYIGDKMYVLDPEYDHQMSLEFCRFYFSGGRNEDIPVCSQKDPYGIKNVCFSLIDDTDSRWDEFTKQRLERGFDNSETWSLDGTIARFIAPRLEVFIEDVKALQCHPWGMDFDEWLDILTRMSKGFNLMASDEEKSEEEDKIIDEALELFAKHFHVLWT